MGMSNKWDRVERWSYRLLVAVHLLPILASRWFVTVDGPCHLYDARIIRDLVFGDPFVADFFHLAPYPEPYWLGQAIMATLLVALPAWVVEKIIWSAAVLGLAWAFRSFIRTIAPQRIWASLLVLPFLLNYAVRMGFLNFSLSLSLFFLALNMGWRIFSGERSRPVLLAFVSTLLYFAHLSTFILCFGILMAGLVWTVLTGPHLQPGALRRMGVSIGAALLLPTALTFGYIVTHHTLDAVTNRLPLAELLRYIVEGRAWNALGADGEYLACVLTAVPLLLAGSIATFVRIKNAAKPVFRPADFWALLTLSTFIAYLVLPDTVAGGSSASPRMLLFSMFFLCAWLAVSEVRGRSIGFLTLAVLLADLEHTRIQYDTAASLGQECTEYLSVADALEDRTVLLPLNYGSNWMHANFPNYLGTFPQRVIVLDHFTALNTFNPAQWNADRHSYEAVGSFASSLRPCVRLHGYEDSTGIAIDQVVTWKLTSDIIDSCARDVRSQLAAQYREVMASPLGDAKLYEKHH